MQEAKVEVTVEDFILQFPEFSDNPDNTRMLERAQCYVSTVNYGALTDCCRKLAIYLFTAHLLTLQNKIKERDMTTGMQTGASIDKINVTITPPPSTDQFEYWLNLTPYGAQLLALISSRISTPQIVGGSFVRVL